MKKCSCCSQVKESKDFCFHKIQKDGLSSVCRQCSSEYKSKYYRTKGGLVSKIYAGQKTSSKRRGHSMPNYTREELEGFIFSQPNFEILYSNWANSDFDKNLIPSIDRKDDYKPYTIDNLRLVTWGENNKKGNSDRKNNINRKVNKSVVQMSLDLTVIGCFDSIMDAQRATGVGNSEISKCCRKVSRYKTAGGFIWKFKEVKDV